GYFGQPSEDNCGRCDNCDAGRAAPPEPDGREHPYPLGGRVVHATFGAGEVVAYEGDTMTVLFDDAGYRNLSVELVLARNLLQPA
ncbi:MAG: ATP-dependent helicase RecQ, partial [Actinomycetota bacterium]|nr:ATP-dependent helicase RecQ [Actinomycetota bacterium]